MEEASTTAVSAQPSMRLKHRVHRARASWTKLRHCGKLIVVKLRLDAEYAAKRDQAEKAKQEIEGKVRCLPVHCSVADLCAVAGCSEGFRRADRRRGYVHVPVALVACVPVSSAPQVH